MMNDKIIGKKFLIKLKDGTIYTLKVTSSQHLEDGKTLIGGIDKYDNEVFISASDILRAEEMP
jgi:small nuclear ribonucleoprotein (snRNP)-like protein